MKMSIYGKRNAFGLQQKEAVFVGFKTKQTVEEFGIFWKLIENFLLLL